MLYRLPCIGALVVLLGVLGCQAATAVAPPTATVAVLDEPSQVVERVSVWGEVPKQCA
jgi:hypothetical protein